METSVVRDAQIPRTTIETWLRDFVAGRFEGVAPAALPWRVAMERLDSDAARSLRAQCEAAGLIPEARGSERAFGVVLTHGGSSEVHFAPTRHGFKDVARAFTDRHQIPVRAWSGNTWITDATGSPVARLGRNGLASDRHPVFCSNLKLGTVSEHLECARLSSISWRVAETHEMSAAEYDEFTNALHKSYPWLAGKGGASSDYTPKAVVEDPVLLPDDERRLWQEQSYIEAVQVIAPGRPPLLGDPEGYQNARYVGFIKGQDYSRFARNIAGEAQAAYFGYATSATKMPPLPAAKIAPAKILKR